MFLFFFYVVFLQIQQYTIFSNKTHFLVRPENVYCLKISSFIASMIIWSLLLLRSLCIIKTNFFLQWKVSMAKTIRDISIVSPWLFRFNLLLVDSWSILFATADTIFGRNIKNWQSAVLFFLRFLHVFAPIFLLKDLDLLSHGIDCCAAPARTESCERVVQKYEIVKCHLQRRGGTSCWLVIYRFDSKQNGM